MSLTDLPIGIRLSIAFGTMFLGLISLAGVAWWAIGGLSTTVADMYQNNTIAGTELARSSASLLNYRNLIIQIIGTQSKEDFEEMAAELPKHRAGVEHYIRAYRDRTMRSLDRHDEGQEFASLQDSIQEYFALDQRTIDRIKSAMDVPDIKERERLRQAAIQNSFYAAGPSMNATGSAMDTLLDTVVTLAKDSKEASDRTNMTARYALLLTLLVCLVSAIVVTWMITVSITRPLNQVNDVLAQMEHGDLTHRLTYSSKDELGVVCANINHFVDRLHELIGHVVRSTRTLTQSASQLSFVVEQVTTASETQSKHATGAASIVSDMAINTTRVSDEANAVSNKAVEAQSAATEGGVAINTTITSMQNVFSAIQHSADMIQHLGATSREIGNIAGVIDDIAEQTNLLALNAAIEAARAGEQGRGFAVVADEVRKLAERTSRATKEIGSMISTIQKDTAAAMDSMAASSSRVSEGKHLVDQTGGHLERIVASVGRVTEMVHDIAGQTEAQSATSNLIAGTINDIASMSHSNKEIVGKLFAEALTLMNTAASFKQSIEVFKLREELSPKYDQTGHVLFG